MEVLDTTVNEVTVYPDTTVLNAPAEFPVSVAIASVPSEMENSTSLF